MSAVASPADRSPRQVLPPVMSLSQHHPLPTCSAFTSHLFLLEVEKAEASLPVLSLFKLHLGSGCPCVSGEILHDLLVLVRFIPQPIFPASSLAMTSPYLLKSACQQCCIFFPQVVQRILIHSLFVDIHICLLWMERVLLFFFLPLESYSAYSSQHRCYVLY